MKPNSRDDVDCESTEILNPVYAEKTFSCFIQAFIRFIDIIAGFVGVFLLIPVSIYVIIEKNVKNEKGPIFYYQTRIGKNGKTFKMYRLNTKSILCEIPQFINVLAGTMTLVGPRPYTVKEKEKMGDYFNIISSVKPGITGVYQISGRRVEFDERLDLDVHYILNYSLKLDFKIILITLFVTIRNKNLRYYQKYIYGEISKEAVNNYLLKNVRLFIKRLIDIIGGLVGIIVLIPTTIIIGIFNFIFKEDGPIFYSQERIGKDGKKFKMYKYRSMIVDADKKLNELLNQDDALREEFEKNRKLKNDPRITKIGRFLRKTSLDELPQLINVLKGDMSLVGPRAVVDGEIELFGENKEKVLSVKPGITGYWAANGRSNTTYEERVDMETYYAENFNLLLDIKILLKTVASVVKREGAI